jgi:transcriptional regulator GlxA family with amidase domain
MARLKAPWMRFSVRLTASCGSAPLDLAADQVRDDFGVGLAGELAPSAISSSRRAGNSR